jgi:hypothetical protein
MINARFIINVTFNATIVISPAILSITFIPSCDEFDSFVSELVSESR